MSLNPWDLDKYSQDIVEHYIDVEQLIINRIIDSMTQNAKNDDISDISDNVSSYAEMLIKYAKRLQKKVRGNVNRAKSDNIDPLDNWLMKHNESVIKNDKGITKRRLSETDDYMKLISRNMTRNSADAVRHIVTSATNEFKMGKLTKEQAVGKVLHQWADNGIPALIDRVGKQWSPETYVRTVMQTQANRLANEATLQRLKDNGQYVDISAHVGARPLCAPYQGKRYSMLDDDPKYPSFYSTSYGQAAGILGINCHHHLLPVANDGSVYNPPNIDDEENARVYKQTQQQRRYERDIRRTKRHVQISKNTNDGMLEHYQQKLKRQQSRLRKFTNSTGLRRQRNREKNII